MAQRNIILYFDCLSSHDISWVFQHKAGDSDAVVHGSLKQAAKNASGCKVTLLVSASHVLLNDVKLPSMNKQRTLRAVPYAMEDQLAADLESLHFAIGERYDSGELGVAICNKEQINLWLEELKKVGIYPDSIASDINGVAFEEDTWTLYLNDTSALGVASLRIDEQAGMGIDIQNIAPILTMLFEKLEPEQRPKRLCIVTHEQSMPAHVRDLAQLSEPFLAQANDGSETEADVDWENERTQHMSSVEPGYLSATDETVPGISAANSDTLLPPLAPSVEEVESDSRSTESSQLIASIQDVCARMTVEGTVETISEQRLSYLAKNYSSDEAINLLQGEFSRKEQLERLFKPWIPAAAIAAIWMFLQIGLFIVDYQTLSAKEIFLRQQVVTIYKQVFPNTKNLVDPKRQMESGLKKLKRNQTGGGGGFISLLHKAGAVLSDTQAMTIKSMRFKANKLDIDMEIADLQALDELKSRLVGVGTLQVEIVSASAKEGKVKSRIQLRPKS